MTTLLSLKKTRAGSRSSQTDRPRPGRSGFSLVEVVVAIGLFAFCIVAMVGLLEVALSSTRASHVDSSVASVIGNLSANLNSLEPGDLASLGASNQYFDLAGMPVPSGSVPTVHFRAKLEAIEPGFLEAAFALPGGTNLRAWAVSIDYPAPVYRHSMRYLIGRRSW